MIPAYLFKPARKDGWTLLICGSCNQGDGQSHPSENLGLASPRFSPSIPSRRRQKEHTRGWLSVLGHIANEITVGTILFNNSEAARHAELVCSIQNESFVMYGGKEDASIPEPKGET